MPWTNNPESRRRSDATYQDPAYKRNRAICLRRAAGRCQTCGHKHTRLQVDHILPRSQGGGHDLANLQALCVGEGSCKCHEKKTATEGGGFRSAGNLRRAVDPNMQQRTAW